jgi:protease secretion system outer membrane protein
MLDQGRVARVVLLRAEAALSSARADHAVAEAQREVAERDVARVMSVEVDVVRARALLPLAVPGAPPPREVAMARAVEANPELERLRAQLAGTGAGEAEVGAQWWPRVLLGGRYVRYGSGQGDAGGEWQGGMQLSYALFDGGSRPAAQDRARAETRAAAAELAFGEQRVAESVDRAYAALISAAARRSALADAASQSEEVVRIERLALDAGAGVQTDYLAADAELLRVRAALTDARFAEVVAHVELARAMGTLSLEWIEQNVEAGS